MRIKGLSKPLSTFGILAVLAACSPSRSKYPSPSTRETLPTSQSVVPESKAPSDQSIRSIDFSNFVFSLPRELGDAKGTLTLRGGKLEPTRDEKGRVDGMGATLEGIVYGDLTKDGTEEAIVVLSVITGGSAIPHAVYVYSAHSGIPKLLWAFSTGDRADGGLRRVYQENGQLVLELFGRNRVIGGQLYTGDEPLCCPAFFTRMRYNWTGKDFKGMSKEVMKNDRGDANPVIPH